MKKLCFVACANYTGVLQGQRCLFIMGAAVLANGQRLPYGLHLAIGDGGLKEQKTPWQVVLWAYPQVGIGPKRPS